MKIAKQSLSMIFVFAISLYVPLCAQEDAINKQQVYGQALYERTCSIIDENDSNAQNAAENLVQTIMADQEIYVLLNIGKNEGFTVAELLGFAKTIAQENEDQEVVQILQNVQQEAAKNWFSKHPVITTMSALVIAAGGVFAYVQKEDFMDLFRKCLDKLGLGAKPNQTEAERLAAEQAAARLAAEQELARIAAEQEVAEKQLLAVQEEMARLKAEQEALKVAEVERLVRFDREREADVNPAANANADVNPVTQTEAERLAAEQEAEAKGLEAGQAEVERLTQFDRALNEASMTTEEFVTYLQIEVVGKKTANEGLEAGQAEAPEAKPEEVNSDNGAETESDSLSDDEPEAPEVNPEVVTVSSEPEAAAENPVTTTERKLTVTPEVVSSEEESSEANEQADAANLALKQLEQEEAEETIEEEHDRIAAALEEQFALVSTDETDSEEEIVLVKEIMGENPEVIIDAIIDGSETAGTEVVAEDKQEVTSEVTTETKSEVIEEENTSVDETAFWL